VANRRRQDRAEAITRTVTNPSGRRRPNSLNVLARPGLAACWGSFRDPVLAGSAADTGEASAAAHFLRSQMSVRE
jgi:hypothetical protein